MPASSSRHPTPLISATLADQSPPARTRTAVTAPALRSQHYVTPQSFRADGYAARPARPCRGASVDALALRRHPSRGADAAGPALPVRQWACTADCTGRQAWRPASGALGHPDMQSLARSLAQSARCSNRPLPAAAFTSYVQPASTAFPSGGPSPVHIAPSPRIQAHRDIRR